MTTQLDANTVTLLRNALHDANMAGTILAQAAMRGSKAKPTMAELNELIRHTDNARTFLKAALSAA